MVDAALAEFAPDDDLAGLLAARERVLIVRSFSKAHAMAGLRAGYALANDADVLDRDEPGRRRLGSRPGRDAVGGPRRRRRWSRAAAPPPPASASGWPTPCAAARSRSPPATAASSGSRSSEEDGAAIARRLAAQRIYVTPGAAWGDEQHVRIALRDGAATDRLVAALLD